MADATSFNANADMACGRIDDCQVGELQLGWAYRRHRPIGGLRRRHSRLLWISLDPKLPSGNGLQDRLLLHRGWRLQDRASHRNLSTWLALRLVRSPRF